MVVVQKWKIGGSESRLALSFQLKNQLNEDTFFVDVDLPFTNVDMFVVLGNLMKHKVTGHILCHAIVPAESLLQVLSKFGQFLQTDKICFEQVCFCWTPSFQLSTHKKFA